MAKPLNELAPLQVTREPAAGQGLSLTETGAVPDPVTGLFMPWVVDVNVYMTAVSHTNFNTLTVHAAASSIYNGAKESSGAQNDEINFDVVLAAGTWTIEVLHVKDSNRGIYAVSLGDGTNMLLLNTIDGYAAATSFNNRVSISGVTVAATGKQRLRLKMTAKNISSSNYYGSLQHIQFRRTA